MSNEKTAMRSSVISRFTNFTAADIIKALSGAGKQPKLSERIAMLAIPEKELTQSVGLAVTALLEKIDDLSREVSRTKEQLTELEQLVDVDCIAPIPNRRAFTRRLSWALAMHERYGHPSSVLYFDLNGFKAINDTYGHAAGDTAIKHVSQILLSALRDSDFLARVGGDEFAIIMYYASAADALERGKKIAALIQNTPFVYNGKKLQLSSAFGTYAVQKGDDVESAISAADTAMYLDKKRGKARATDIEA